MEDGPLSLLKQLCVSLGGQELDFGVVYGELLGGLESRSHESSCLLSESLAGVVLSLEVVGRKETADKICWGVETLLDLNEPWKESVLQLLLMLFDEGLPEGSTKITERLMNTETRLQMLQSNERDDLRVSKFSKKVQQTVSFGRGKKKPFIVACKH